MPKPIYIHIPKPCSQNWDEMTPDGMGRHCAHCSKTVIDFTTWSDSALYNYFSKNKEHVCGRFLASQVDRPIAIPYQPHSRLYRMTIALGLTLLIIQTPHLLAQNRSPITVQSTVATKPQFVDIPGHGELYGRAVDEKKEPVVNAVVQILQDGIVKGGNVADYDGNYSVRSLSGKYDVLVRVSLGYDSLYINDVFIGTDQKTKMNFLLKRSNTTYHESHMMIYKQGLIDHSDDKILTKDELDKMRH